jgi:hypothetical protein
MIGLRNLGVVIALVAPTLAITLALAATPPTAAVRAACTGDAKKFCGAVIRDADARHKCMIEHRAQLSEGCKAAIADSRKAPAAPSAPPAAAEPPAATAPPAAAPDTK